MIKYMVLCSEGNDARIKNVEIMKQQIPELVVVMSNRGNVFDNHIKAFNLEPEYDGLVMLEDDVQLCKNFKERVEECVNRHKGEVISMFESACSRKPLHSEYRNGWKFAWNQCKYYPRSICKIFADKDWMEPFKEYFFTKLHEPWNYPIDKYQAFVLGTCGISYWMEVPFFVQHLSLESNFKGRPTNRQSKYFIDDLGDEMNGQ